MNLCEGKDTKSQVSEIMQNTDGSLNILVDKLKEVQLSGFLHYAKTI